MYPITSDTHIWIASRQLLRAHGEAFFEQWDKVVKGFGVEEIHDLRVASRRLREGVALFAFCFPDKSLARIGKKVKQVTGILGDLRNTDEAILFFSALEPDERAKADEAVQELLTHLEKERQAARRKLKADLKALRSEPLKAAWSGVLDHPELFDNKRVNPFLGLATYADAAIGDRAQPLHELLPLARDEANVTAQHQLRIAVKRMRYRLEILEPLFSSGFDELHRALKGYQEVLGKLHDLDVFAQMVGDRVAQGGAQQSLLRGIAARRSRLYAFFVAMLDDLSLDAIASKARSCL